MKFIDAPAKIGKHLSTKQISFDPSNPDHRRLFAHFMDHGGWGMPCPFLLEQPYGSIPELCRTRMLSYYMDKDRALVKHDAK